MDFLSTIAEIIPSLWGALSRQIGYVKDLNGNIATLMSEANELKRKRDEVEADVDAAVSVGKKRLRHVENWLVDVGKFVPEVDSMKLEFDQGVNLYSRRKLGRRVVEKIEDVKRLKEKGVFEKVAESPRRPLMQEMQVPKQVEQQSTSQETLEKIAQALSDGEIGIICIYGMGGIGKTTLMKAIYNRVFGSRDFDVVIWVTVSKDLNFEIIQQKIGNKLGLKFDGSEGAEEKRDRLFARLRNVRFMLILDDLWQAFSLDQVGIPQPDKHNLCKIAITTRLIAVCNAMEADSEVKVKPLTREEAWNLFCSKIGDVVLLPDIQTLAVKVVKECGGLPLAIKTVGGAMRGKDKKELWENALRALRVSAPEVPGMEHEVFLPLKLSYDFLGDLKIQLCFLYSAFFPEDDIIVMEELVRYWVFEEGLIDNVDSLEEALDKGHDILERLKDACLLEEVPPYHVRMHDLLRDLAIWITSQSSSPSSKFLVRSGKRLRHPPEEENWEGVGRISLMSNEIIDLQIIPKSSDLISLFLCCNWQLNTIHFGFFQLMPQLRILDLNNTSIQSLPQSLCDLVNLHALILHDCYKLVEMPPLGELNELRLLDISFSGIKNLPEGIANLVKLKQLDLSYTKALATIPCNLISKLTSLEHLNLNGANKMHMTNWQEVATLTRLTSLEINLPDFDGFSVQDMDLLQSFTNLKRFRIHLGGNSFGKIFGFPHAKRFLTVSGHCNFVGDIERLISHVECLLVLESKAPICLSQTLSYANSLKMIDMGSCEEVNCIIDWTDMGDTKALDCLEVLLLQSLPNLEKIFNGGPLQHSTQFQRLQELTIRQCPKLNCIFSSSMVGHLLHLRKLSVEDCADVEEIIQGDILPENMLQRLSSLHLCYLPKLTSICRPLHVLKSLEEMDVVLCPELKKLPCLCSTIQQLRGQICWTKERWDEIEWEDDHSKFLYSTIYRERERRP